MSRAIVINQAKYITAIKKILKAIASAGLPKEIPDMSMPGFALGTISPLPLDVFDNMGIAMSLDGLVPLYLTDFAPGDNKAPAPDLRPVCTQPKATAIRKEIPISPESEPVPVMASELVKTVQQSESAGGGAIKEKPEIDNHMMTDVILASLKESNLEVKAAEPVSPNMTKITLEDVLADRRTKIPEYVLVRR